MNRAGKLFTKLNLHFALLAVLLGVNVFIGVRLALAWRAIRSDQSSEFVQQQIRYGQLQAQMQHLNDLPGKVHQSDEDAQKFYDRRIAATYSTVEAALSGAATRSQVLLSRAGFAPAPAIEGLTEVRIDAGLSGQYSGLIHFINDVERNKDHVFFIIDGITLTGQQGGLVNLRLKLTTYMRAGATDLPPAPPEAQEDAR
jgi:hypothetical protein